MPAPASSQSLALARRIAGPIACGFAALLIAQAASAQPQLASDSPGRVDRICRDVMGLERGEAHYMACTESLAGAARSLNDGRALGQTRLHCLASGLQPGEPDFNVCELRAAQTAHVVPMAAARGEPAASASYFYASPRAVFHREQTACAWLGFDPAGGGFDSCVASLKAAMFQADNPAQ